MTHPESMDDLKRLYAAAPADEPPAALDAAVLKLAREHAEAASDVAPGMSSSSSAAKRRVWGPRMAMAAMLVLTVSLVLMMEREQPEVADVAGVPGVAPPARDIALAPAPPQPPAAVAGSPRALARSSPEREPVANRADGKATMRERGEWSDSRERAELRRRVETAAPAAAERRLDAAQPVARSAPDAMPGASMSAAAAGSPNTASSASPNASTGTAAASAEKSDTGARAQAFSAPAAAAPPSAQARQSAGASVDVRGPGTGMRDAPAARSAPARETAQADEPPDAWLRRLAELKQQGRAKEFEEGLAEFRKRHPNWRIPESLLPAK